MRLRHGPPTAGSAPTLPSDLRGASHQRLSVFAWISGALWLVYQILYSTVWADRAILALLVVGIAMVVYAVCVALMARSTRWSALAIEMVGYSFEIATCFAITFGDFLGLQRAEVASQVSWAGIVIVFYPLLVATRPRATLISSFLAATMGPAGYLAARLAGSIEIAEPGVLFSHFLPLYLAALMAYLAARVLHRLTTDVSKARRLGSYELLERLATGGMGEVWRARHRLLARPAAIKLIRPDAGGLQSLRERFEREAQVTATLESPHTVDLYDYGISDNGVFFYVMELLRGVDLETLVKTHGPQPAGRVVAILLQACDSLDDAHRAGLVHRDIKPANLFLSRRSNKHDFIKVLDFGLVAARRDDGAVGQTGDRIVGTPAYLAPEMVAQKKIDGRADIYALACVGYWLLTGTLVFQRESAMQVVVAHATEAPQPPRERTNNPVPADLEAVILRCLAKEPDDRPDSAAELARVLRDCEVDAWTEDHAAAWWREHLADVAERPVPTSSSGTPTAFINRAS